MIPKVAPREGYVSISTDRAMIETLLHSHQIRNFLLTPPHIDVIFEILAVSIAYANL